MFGKSELVPFVFKLHYRFSSFVEKKCSTRDKREISDTSEDFSFFIA
jgi:hypothetical protein